MKIKDLIERLEYVEKQHGNIECVQEAEDFFGNKINSTIERADIVKFNNEKAVRLDWRT